jgi:hypothetical protein
LLPRIVSVKHLGGHRLEIVFSTGERAEMDFRARIVGRGGVFSPLEDIDFLSRVNVDPEFGALVWPNDVDFCPDALYLDCTRSAAEATSQT